MKLPLGKTLTYLRIWIYIAKHFQEFCADTFMSLNLFIQAKTMRHLSDEMIMLMKPLNNEAAMSEDLHWAFQSVLRTPPRVGGSRVTLQSIHSEVRLTS